MQKINRLALSIALSIISGGLVLILSVWNSLTNFGVKVIDLFISIHPTVFQKVEGNIFKNLDFILVNTIYALIDGFILGFLIALTYNWLIDKLLAKKDSKSK